ncbi:MAG: LamG domain-containing protein, partial [Kofleriaceae bacterium]
IVTSPGSQSIPAGSPATIDVAITNNNTASCAAAPFQLSTFFFGDDVTLDPAPGTSVSIPVASGQTKHFTITATPGVDVEPGTSIFIDFDVFDPLSMFSQFGSSFLSVTEPVGCHVSTSRELTIKNTSVVDDSLRTGFDPSSSDPRNGVWSFKHLVENMAATPADAPAMVEAMLTSMTTPQTINGFTIDGRPGMQTIILDNWPRSADGSLDLAQAPLRLIAIVNRFDLRNLAHGDGGEGRFVFGFADPTFFDFSMQATLILEYKLPAASDADVQSWADSFHALGALAFGESYNAALQLITERFVGRNARPDHPNGSAINAVRTNEIAFGGGAPWEMRQFALSAATGRLEPTTLDLTPDRSFNFSDTLVSYINDNQAAIIAETHTVPASFAGQPFQAGAVFNDLTTWFAFGADNEARHHFALNTCNGCHSSQETGTFFLQIAPQFPFGEAALSGFLTGITVGDPVTGQSRRFNDLGRRNSDLKAIVCADPSLAGTSLRKGIQRVH